jgi:hypothetical protein
MPKKVLDMCGVLIYPLDRVLPARPKDPLRAERMPVIAPVDFDARTDTRPNPDGFCFPTPLPVPSVREEKIVGRGAGR